MQRGLPDWQLGATYQQNSRVIGDDGNTYLSLINNNTGFTPSYSPTQWQSWGLTIAQVDAATLTQGTASGGDSSTKVANTAFVQNAVAPLSTSIATLNGEVTTLNSEIATADGNITTLQGQVTTIDGQLTSIDSSIATANTNITNLQAFESGFTSGSNSNGHWEKNPAGRITQWSQVTTDINNGTIAISFPINFTNAASVSVVVTTYSATDRITYVVYGSISTAGFTIGNNGSGGYATWQAIGY
jgi:hypothetical protein